VIEKDILIKDLIKQCKNHLFQDKNYNYTYNCVYDIARGNSTMSRMEPAASFEERSFVNLVRFYEPELRQVLDGGSAMAVFSDNEREGLRRKGVLHVHFESGYGKFFELSERALEALETTSP